MQSFFVVFSMEHQYPQEFVENIEKIVGSSEENNMNSVPEESATNELTVDDSVWRTGQVSEWKTTWGFITPLEETTEEKAARNRNRIFIHASKLILLTMKSLSLEKECK